MSYGGGQHPGGVSAPQGPFLTPPTPTPSPWQRPRTKRPGHGCPPPVEVAAVQAHHYPAVGQAGVVRLEVPHVLELAFSHEAATAARSPPAARSDGRRRRPPAPPHGRGGTGSAVTPPPPLPAALLGSQEDLSMLLTPSP